MKHHGQTRRSLDHEIVASEEPHNAVTMVIVGQNESNDQVNPKDELQDRLMRHEVQLQLLVNTIQDMKKKRDYMLEKKENTPPREGRLEDDLEHEKEDYKIPPKEKQQNKGSNPKSEKVLSLTKTEMRAEVQKMIAEAGGISSCPILRRKAYSEWME